MIVKAIGILFIVWGMLDIVMGKFGVDVWNDWLGITLSDLPYRFIGLASIILGVVIYRVGMTNNSNDLVEKSPE